jgi:CO/xanthine dehydrogenase Mo-binding subunit
MSCVLYEGDNGYCAMVAEVDVNQDSGLVAVRRLVIANDSGPILEPGRVAQSARGRGDSGNQPGRSSKR